MLMEILNDPLTLRLFEELKYKPSALYKTFGIPKRNGTIRRIDEPREDLKCIQRSIAKRLVKENDFPSEITAISGRGLKNHLLPHVGKKLVITHDIENFFPSVKPSLVRESLLQHSTYSADDVNSIVSLTTYDGSVPQGAPSSVVITGLVLIAAINRVKKIFPKAMSNFSIYVDDLAISGDNSAFKILDELSVEFSRIGLKLNKSKRHIMRSNRNTPVICGLEVGEEIKVTSEYLHQIIEELSSYSLCQLSDVDPKLYGKINHVKNYNNSQFSIINSKLEENEIVF